MHSLVQGQLFVLCLVALARAQLLSPYTYLPITSACIPLFNVSAQVGCTSRNPCRHFRLTWVAAGTRVEAILRNGLTRERLDSLLQEEINFDVGIAMDSALLTVENLHALKEHMQERLIGVIIIRNDSIEAFSPETEDLGSDHKWNPGVSLYNGSCWLCQEDGLLYEKFDFGMVLVEDQDTVEVIKQYAMDNEDTILTETYVPYTVQFTSTTSASTSSKECITNGKKQEKFHTNLRQMRSDWWSKYLGSFG